MCVCLVIGYGCCLCALICMLLDTLIYSGINKESLSIYLSISNSCVRVTKVKKMVFKYVTQDSGIAPNPTTHPITPFPFLPVMSCLSLFIHLVCTVQSSVVIPLAARWVLFVCEVDHVRLISEG